MKEILIPLNFTTTPTVYDTKQSFSTSDEASGVLTFTTTADVTGTVASLTLRNASENANRQTVLIERLDVNSSPFSYTLKNPLPFGQYEGTVLLKKNLTVIASATFLFGVNSSLAAEVLPDLVKAYSLDELVENVETEVSNLKDAVTLTVSETVKGVNKTESSLQAQENVRYLNEHARKANELERISNEQARVAAELARKETFDTLVDSEVIEQTVVQEVAEKYQEIEALNAPEMVSFRQQLAQTNAQVDLLNRGLGETIPSLAVLNATYPTGDTKDHIVAGNIAEVDTLTVTAIPTVASNITVTLNGVATTVAVDPAVQTTVDLVAAAIRAKVFTGWTTGGTGSVVTFTANTTGARTAPTFAGGTTGATATFAITTKGENANFHRYFWDGSWKDGGAYQTFEITDKSVNHNSLDDTLHNAYRSSDAVVDKMFNVSLADEYRFLDGTYTNKAYWSDVAGVAGFKTNFSYYYAMNDLIPVTAGQKLTLKKWGDMTGGGPSILLPTIAYSAYKADKTPYDGVSSRINYSAGVYNAIEDTFTFIIPAGTELIGISIRVEFSTNIPKTLDDSAVFIGDSNVSLTTSMKTEVVNAIDNTFLSNPHNADYYQKGGSVKTFSDTKKIAIIVAGQSNADGRVPVANLPTYLTLPLTNCYYASNYTVGGPSGTFQTEIGTEDLASSKWAFDLLTYYHLTQTAGKTIYVMKHTMGGTSIDPTGDNTYHWTADYEKLSNASYSLLLKFESLIRACIASQGSNFDVRAMIWHQGEADRASYSQTAADNYYDNLKHVISYCRGIIGNKRLPFICGTVSQNSGQYDATVDAAIRKLASEDPYMFLVDMSGGTLLDAYHFDATSSEYFGKMCYDELIDAGVISATKLNPTRPW